jgi:hypothetical protein
MKLTLIGSGRITPSRELLFVPTSGAKAIKTVATILGGRDNDLPVIFCDGDAAGVTLAKTLKEEMYSDCPERVVLATDVLTAIKNAEVEDFMPLPFLGPIIDRFLRGPDDETFSLKEKDGPIVPQIKAYAQIHKLTLVDGWKVEVAKLAKTRIPANVMSDAAWSATVNAWQQLFERLMGTAPTAPLAGGVTRSAN